MELPYTETLHCQVASSICASWESASSYHTVGAGETGRLHKLYMELVLYINTTGYNPSLQSMLALQPSILRGSI